MTAREGKRSKMKGGSKDLPTVRRRADKVRCFSRGTL